jgi:hypothetical protein
LALGLVQADHRPDLELRSKSLDRSYDDRAFTLVVVRDEEQIAAAASGQDVDIVGRHKACGAPGSFIPSLLSSIHD